MQLQYWFTMFSLLNRHSAPNL